MNSFIKFLHLLDRRGRLQLSALFILILVGVLLETFTVGLIYSFISILKRPEVVHDYKVLHWIYSLTGTLSMERFLTWATVGLILIYLFKNVYLVLLSYAQSRFIYNKQSSFSIRLFSFYLYKPYTFHLQRNTSELLHKINNVIPLLFGGFLLNALMLVIEAITAVSILCLLIVIEPLLSIIIVSAMGAATFAFYRLNRKKVSEFGKLRQYYGEKMFQWVNQGLGGVKETKILGREAFFINEYGKNSVGYVHSERFIHVINQLPRPFLETISIVSMLLITLVAIAQNNEFQSIIPKLSLFAIAAFRIIPSMNRIFASATAIRYNSYSLNLVYNDLVMINTPVHSGENGGTGNASVVTGRGNGVGASMVFNERIELKKVCYQYPNAGNAALSNASLIIPKNYSVGIVGHSGAGKTTIVDVILGLLTPTQGEVLVDGKNIKNNLSAWQRKIGYIPQSIYLSDDTILRNVAFGLPDEQIDENRVWSVLESAQLKELVSGLSDNLNTYVGERGIRLSGGQRQRIGIARALYHNPEILVMDEGTASLDNETEREIMQALNRLSGKKTLIIIAHRLSTVKNCDQLYFVRDGEVADYGTYEELLDKSLEFKSMVMSTEYK